MGYKALLQIGLIGIAVVLVFVYIKPTFANIGELQKETKEYQDAVSKASEFNGLLNSKVQKVRSYSQQDIEALNRFLPDSIDEAQVIRDLEALFEDYDVELSMIASGAEDSNSSNNFEFEGDFEDVEQDILPYKDFSVSIVDNYESIKKFLALVESNAYPLEVVKLTFGYQQENLDDEELAALAESDEEQFACEMVLRVSYLYDSAVIDN